MAINVRADIEAAQKKKKKIDVKEDIARTAAPKISTKKQDKSYTGVDAEINRREASRSARYSMQPEVRAAEIKRAETRGDTKRASELKKATDIEAWANEQVDSNFVRSRAQTVYDNEFNAAKARGDQSPAVAAEHAAQGYLDLFRNKPQETRNETYAFRQAEKLQEAASVFASNDFGGMSERGKLIGINLDGNLPKSRFEKIITFVNNDPYRNSIEALAIMNHGDSNLAKQISQLTEDEKKIIRYYAARGEKDKVEEFYRLMERELNERLQTAVNEQTRQEAYDKPVLGAVKNVAGTMAAPAGYAANAGNAIANVFRDDYIPTDYNTPVFSGAHMAEQTSAGVTERASDAAGGGVAGEFASLLAGTGLSIANQLVTLPMGAAGSLAYMSAEAAGQTTLDALKRGASAEQALFLSTAAGAIEAMTEKLPLDNLFKVADEFGEKGLKNFIKTVIKEAPKQGITEAGEEIVSEIANTIMDIAVMKDKSGYEQYIAELMQNGMSRAEAEKEALIGYLGKNVLMAGAGGLISGIAMGSGAATVSHARGAIQSRNAGVAEGEAGFTKNEYSGKVSNKTIRALDAIGKKLGVNIQIGAPTGTGEGAYNGYYENGRIVIAQDAENPLEVVLSHEVTHHMKTAAPAEYAKFAELAINASTKLEGTAKAELISRYRQSYAEGTQTDFTEDAAIDEITADYASKLVNDVETFRELVRADMTVAERFIESIKEFIAKVKTTFSKDKTKADTASLEKYGATVSELEAAVKTYEDIIKTTQAAVASGQFGIENTAETEQGGVAYSFEESHVESKKAEVVKKDAENHSIRKYNFKLAEKHKDEIAKNYSDDATVSLDEINSRYDKILEIWERLGGKLDSDFLRQWDAQVGMDRAFSVFKAQAGYKYNTELSSMCKKGIPLFEAIDRIVKQEVMNELKVESIGKAEKEILYDILKQHSLEIPCAICYVEQARQGEGRIINDFLNGKVDKNKSGKITRFKLGWNDTIKRIQEEMRRAGVEYTFPKVDRSIATNNYNPAELAMDEQTQEAFFAALKKIANEEIRRYNKSENKNRPLVKKVDEESIKQAFKGTLPANLAMFKTMFLEPKSRFLIDDDLLYSSMTTHNLAKSHNQLYTLFNMQGGTSGYKTKQGAIVYWGDILKKNWDSDKLRREGGVRNQSNSDFMMYTLLDQAQMYIDFTAKGYYLQAYTKVLAELKLFGLSKGKINASFIPQVKVFYNADGTIDTEKTMQNAGLDENGNPIYDDIEGINHKEAFMLLEDDDYSKNIAGVCIGYSDKHISKLLDDKRIQMIIGFHDKTNDPEKRYRGARYAKNYNGINEATNKKSGKTVHIGFNDFILRAEAKFKGKDRITYKGKSYSWNDVPKLAADLYLESCERRGLNPAYSQGETDFSTHPNYYKLLADYGLYDSQGNYAPHERVEYHMPDKVPYLDENGNKAYVNAEDYIEKELKAELAVRDDIATKLADKSEDGIIPQFIKRVNENAEARAKTESKRQYSFKKTNEASGVAAYESILDVAKKDSYATVSQIKSSFESGSAERLALEELEKRGCGNKNAHNLMRRLIDKGKRAARATASPQAEQAQIPQEPSMSEAETGSDISSGKTTLSADNLPTIRKIGDYAVDDKKATVSELKKKFERGSKERKLLISYIKKGYGKENAYKFIKEIEESILRERRRVQPATAPTPAPVETEPAKVPTPAPVEVEVETANAEEPEPVVEEPPKVSEPEPAPEEIPEATSAEDEESYIRDTGLDGYFEDIHERAQTAQDKRIEDAERALMSTPERQKKTMREKVKESRDFLKRKIENSGAALRDIAKKTKDKSIYPIYNRARGAMNIVSDMITNKQTNIRGEKVGESLEAIITPIKEKGAEYFRDFQLYLLHKHNVARMSLRDTKAEEIAKTDLEIFIRDNPGIAAMGETELERASQWDDVKGIKAKQYIELRERLNRLQNTKNKPIFFDNDEVPLSAAESRRAAEELLKKNPEFTEDEAKIRTYLDNLMQYRVDTGLITQQEAEYFKKKYPDYIPTYRDTESVQKQLQGKLNIGKTVGKARGGNDPILPLDVALAEMTKKVVRSGQKNIFANKVFSLYDKHSKLLERYITDVQEGKVDTDAEIDGFGEERADDNTVTFHNDGKRIELTVTPELYESFAEMSKILKEQAPVADWWRKINNGYKKLITTYDPTFIIRNGIKDLQDAIINSRDTKAMLKNLPKAYAEIANGGEMFELYRSMGGLHSSRFEEIKTKGVEKKSWAKKLPDALAFGNMMVEQAPRLAEFMSVLEKGDRNDLDVLADALYAAADVTTNFGESGTWGKVLNAYYVPFLNPAIQGMAKIGRLITEPKTAKQWYGLAAKAVIMGVGAGFINDIIIGIFGDDEEKEEYEKLQERVKDNYFLIPTDDGKFVKIPKGRIAASLGVIADRVRDVAKGEKVSAGEALVRILENIAPENPITNNIFSPFIDAKLFNNESKGRTWYGGDIESDSLQGLPAGERFDSSTDYISKYVGKALGLSPKKINYILKQYTGGAGRTILPMLTPSEQKGDTIAGVIGYGALSILTSNFMVDSKLSNKVSGDFYDMVSEAEQKKNSSKGTLADKVVYKHLNRERNQMSGYNKKIREAETDSGLTSKERDVAVRAATASRTEYQKEVIDNLDQYRKNVEKYLKEYPGKDEEKKIDYAYRKANYATYGAEYAIRVNGGKSVYEKAAEKVKRGNTTWKEYYEEYFGRDERRYELLRDKYGISYAEYEKIAEAMSKNSTEEEEIEALHKLGYKRSTARAIRRNFNKVK